MTPRRCLRCDRENPQRGLFCIYCGAALLMAAVDMASVWRRAGANTIDNVVLGGGFLVSLFLSSLLGAGGPSGGGLLFLMGLLYQVLFIGLLGQTPGKMLVDVRVVNRAGHVPGIGRAALRELVGKFLSSMALGLGFLWAAWDRENRGWHDHIAGTYVIRTR